MVSLLVIWRKEVNLQAVVAIRLAGKSAANVKLIFFQLFWKNLIFNSRKQNSRIQQKELTVDRDITLPSILLGNGSFFVIRPLHNNNINMAFSVVQPVPEDAVHMTIYLRL